MNSVTSSPSFENEVFYFLTSLMPRLQFIHEISTNLNSPPPRFRIRFSRGMPQLFSDVRYLIVGSAQSRHAPSIPFGRGSNTLVDWIKLASTQHVFYLANVRHHMSNVYGCASPTAECRSCFD